MKKTLTLLALTASISAPAIAQDCARIGFEKEKVYGVNSNLHNYTHIILPEKIKQNTKPIIGNSALWSVDHAGPHIYVKPLSSDKEGKTTSLSAIGESGVSYDFKVARSSEVASGCVQISEGLLFDDAQRQAFHKENPLAGADSERANLWRDKYMQQQTMNDEAIRKAVSDALRRYRFQIYTRYDWNRERVRLKQGERVDNGFIGTDLISDVYDDGRFTYIRVHNSNKGIMIVEAELEGQTEIVQAKFDSLTKMYTVSGIYPKFTLKYNDTEINISRSDNYTAGAY